MSVSDQIPGDTRPQQPSMDVVQRIARLTRMLRESMRELGLDYAIKEAAQSIPDARDRLRYVGRMTEQAANRVLNAAEQAQPLQDELTADAKSLQERWNHLDQGVCNETQADLIADTRQFILDIPNKTQQTQDNLMEIIMAQDFQDLTGQVIKGMLGVIGTLETELVQVLMDSVPGEKRDDAESLLNGPVIDTTSDNVVSDQDEVDDLLSSLGF
ncbi:protein phosphatase CheZ [Paenalcaligenes hominis]|uniref:Protein phosphatase CheZ n=2 Tax=Paenalcaligenes hominis TaxID=643674 RepID=A0A1U9K2J1_9BURK|nr:protein phosphatase CheZ [Paenalcaligenes hominis]AQS52248.1 protein phosphatase CheZ [Paenalcaligenes hominis]